jgi:hypothetical protein
MTARSYLAVTGLCALLAVVTQVSAEPGWTLWWYVTSEINGVPVSPGGSWDPLQAAPTEPDCRAAVDVLAPATFGLLMGKFEANGAKTIVEGTTAVLSWVDAKGRHLTRSHPICLPDTVDPRGPKAKP